jgi:hypothetical protein
LRIVETISEFDFVAEETLAVLPVHAVRGVCQ